MDFLPKEIEDIINNYTYQIEHSMKFKSTLDKIKTIRYRVYSTSDCVRSDREHTHPAKHIIYKYFTIPILHNPILILSQDSIIYRI